MCKREITKYELINLFQYVEEFDINSNENIFKLIIFIDNEKRFFEAEKITNPPIKSIIFI